MGQYYDNAGALSGSLSECTDSSAVCSHVRTFRNGQASAPVTYTLGLFELRKAPIIYNILTIINTRDSRVMIKEVRKAL